MNSDKIREIESKDYKEYREDDINNSTYWQEELDGIFPDYHVENISNPDLGYAYSYLISLNPKQETLGEPGLDDLIARQDAFFANIEISQDKPLASLTYWKYPQGSQGQEIEVSENSFSDSEYHTMIRQRFPIIARKYDLIVLSQAELAEEVEDEGQKLTVMQKYFNPMYGK